MLNLAMQIYLKQEYYNNCKFNSANFLILYFFLNIQAKTLSDLFVAPFTQFAFV